MQRLASQHAKKEEASGHTEVGLQNGVKLNISLLPSRLRNRYSSIQWRVSSSGDAPEALQNGSDITSSNHPLPHHDFGGRNLDSAV